MCGCNLSTTALASIPVLCGMLRAVIPCKFLILWVRIRDQEAFLL